MMKKRESYFVPLAGKHDQSDSGSDEDVIQDVEYDSDFRTIIGEDDEKAETRSLSLSRRHSSHAGAVRLCSNALPSWDCLTSHSSVQVFISDIIFSSEEERENGMPSGLPISRCPTADKDSYIIL